MKKLMVLTLAALVVGLMAGGALAQCDTPSEFTIQAVPNTTCTGDGTYVVDFIVTNNTGGALSGLKIQGGTAAWVMPVASVEAGDCGTQVVEGSGVLDTPPPMNPKKSNKGQNKNNIYVYTQDELADGASVTIRIAVSGETDFVCGEEGIAPNVAGNWSASAVVQTGVDAEENPIFEDVKAQALDFCGTPLWITVWDAISQLYVCTGPLQATNEVTVCDFAFECAE